MLLQARGGSCRIHVIWIAPCPTRQLHPCQRLSPYASTSSTLNALDHLAEKTDRSRNWLVARAVEDFVAVNAWQLDKIEAGILRRQSRRVCR